MHSRPAARASRGRNMVHVVGEAVVAAAVVLGVPVTLAGTADASAGGSRWDRIASCESGGNWRVASGNGYYGGLQFSARTWRAFGGSGMPHRASRSQQIRVAERVLAKQGWRAWPVCSRKMGYRH